jgi:hypothetical protein
MTNPDVLWRALQAEMELEDPAYVATKFAHYRPLIEAALREAGIGRIVESRRAAPIVIDESDFGPVHGAAPLPKEMP